MSLIQLGFFMPFAVIGFPLVFLLFFGWYPCGKYHEKWLSRLNFPNHGYKPEFFVWFGIASTYFLYARAFFSDAFSKRYFDMSKREFRSEANLIMKVYVVMGALATFSLPIFVAQLLAFPIMTLPDSDPDYIRDGLPAWSTMTEMFKQAWELGLAESLSLLLRLLAAIAWISWLCIINFTLLGIFCVMIPLDDRWAGILDPDEKDWKVVPNLLGPIGSPYRFPLRTLAYGRAIVSNRYAQKRFQISSETLRESLNAAQIAFCSLLAACSYLLWPTIILIWTLGATALLFPSLFGAL
ncbi:MAG: hypothetical protein EA369_01030 [Bradymonadales bacterium]|nr:MAG: hypothetical protein EA369_01030 [Bradymonadales bacterium]